LAKEAEIHEEQLLKKIKMPMKFLTYLLDYLQVRRHLDVIEFQGEPENLDINQKLMN
jgi:hypothetical protein